MESRNGSELRTTALQASIRKLVIQIHCVIACMCVPRCAVEGIVGASCGSDRTEFDKREKSCNDHSMNTSVQLQHQCLIWTPSAGLPLSGMAMLAESGTFPYHPTLRNAYTPATRPPTQTRFIAVLVGPIGSLKTMLQDHPTGLLPCFAVTLLDVGCMATAA